MITKKDAELIRDALAYAMSLCTSPEQRVGVLNVESGLTKAWADGKMDFDAIEKISEFRDVEERFR